MIFFETINQQFLFRISKVNGFYLLDIFAGRKSFYKIFDSLRMVKPAHCNNEISILGSEIPRLVYINIHILSAHQDSNLGPSP